MPASVTMRYAQSILRRHRDVLLEDGKLDELDAIDIPQMIADTLYIDDAFVAELLDAIDPQPEPAAEVQHAVVAGDCIVSTGSTPAEAADEYAATGLDVRPDGTGGWEAISVSDVDWQPVQIIRISSQLADHIRQHGAPDSWDTIDGVAHLDRAA